MIGRWDGLLMTPCRNIFDEFIILIVVFTTILLFRNKPSSINWFKQSPPATIDNDMLLVILVDSSDYNSNSSGYDQPAESFGTYSQSKSMCSTTSLAPSTQELRDASPWNCKPPPVGTNNNINLYLPWWTNLMTALFPSRFRSWETNLPSDIFSYLLSLLTFW